MSNGKMQAPFADVGAQVLEAAAAVSLLIMDVDGVLTDGGLYYGPDGLISKRFNVQDGLGLTLLKQAGIPRAVITGQDQPCVEKRLQDLDIEGYYPGCFDKRESYESLRLQYGLEHRQVAYIGDDWIDIPLLRRVGFPIAVANAQPEVKDCAMYVTKERGGHGAVREVARLLLHSRGLLETMVDTWKER